MALVWPERATRPSPTLGRCTARLTSSHKTTPHWRGARSGWRGSNPNTTDNGHRASSASAQTLGPRLVCETAESSACYVGAFSISSATGTHDDVWMFLAWMQSMFILRRSSGTRSLMAFTTAYTDFECASPKADLRVCAGIEGFPTRVPATPRMNPHRRSLDALDVADVKVHVQRQPE